MAGTRKKKTKSSEEIVEAEPALNEEQAQPTATDVTQKGSKKRKSKKAVEAEAPAVASPAQTEAPSEEQADEPAKAEDASVKEQLAVEQDNEQAQQIEEPIAQQEEKAQEELQEQVKKEQPQQGLQEEEEEASAEEIEALEKELAEIEAQMQQLQNKKPPIVDPTPVVEEATATVETPQEKVPDKEAVELIRAWDAAFDLANAVMATQKENEEASKARELERQEQERIAREQERIKIEQETRAKILQEQEQERLEREFERLEKERIARELAEQQAAEQAALEEELERIFASGLISKSNNFVEYLFKNNFYLLPPNSVVYGEGVNGFIDVGGTGRKSKNINQYIYNKPMEKQSSSVKIGLPVTDLGSTVLEEYRDISDYIDKKKEISFLQLEHITGTKIALCTFFKPADAAKADAFIKEVTASLPFLINIFRRPLIHLRQAEIIQPVDAVKRVNHLTIRHLSKHPEHWKEFDKDNNIIPARLLTRVYEDDYSIYENVVFRELIDKITTFLQKRAYLLTQILETFTDSVKLDAVNMFNHRNYYLAIGKLYVGFYGMDDNAGIKFSLDSCRYLYKELNNYKNRAVYTKNAKIKASAGEIRRTNILTMHKDYRHVLSLSQTFNKQTVRSRGVGNLTNQVQSQIAYTNFCCMLSVFASSNFNLECITEDAIITRGKLHAEFKLNNWHLSLDSMYNEYLDFDIISAKMTNREGKMSMAFIPMSYYSSDDYKRRLEHICKRLHYSEARHDKYVFLIPFDIDDELYNYSIPLNAWDDSIQYAILPVSITELNSFRRIQKLLLEMMVNTNKVNDVCPFCSAKLTKDKTDKEFSCNRCKMVITNITCSHCNKPFRATYVGAKSSAKDETFKDLPVFLQQEKLHHFRNIVNINKKRFVCPHCGTENSK